MKGQKNLLLLFVAFFASSFLVAVNAQNGRSDRECNDEGYSDICDCDYYKSVQCKKPGYGYNYGNGEGQSYKDKGNQPPWDTDCAACCCITVQDRTPAPTPGNTPNPTRGIIILDPVLNPTRSPVNDPTPVYVPTWSTPSDGGWGCSGSGCGSSWSSGGGSAPKPKPKPKPHKPKPKPKPKPAPKPKPSSGGGSSGCSGSGCDKEYGSSWSGGSVPSTWAVAPSSPISVGTPTVPVSSPTFTPTRSIPTKSDPQTSPPVVPPTKPTPYGYKYGNGEGNSFKQKNGSASMLSASAGGMRANALWIGLGFVVTAMAGFVAGMHVVRRRRISVNNAGAAAVDDSNVEMSNHPETGYVMT